VDEQYSEGQLCELRWTPTAIELHGYWNGRVQGEGAGADDRGEFASIPGPPKGRLKIQSLDYEIPSPVRKVV